MNHHGTIRQWLRADGSGKRYLRVDYMRWRDGRWRYSVVGCAYTLQRTCETCGSSGTTRLRRGGRGEPT